MNPRNVRIGAILVFAVVLFSGFWTWVIERTNVPAGQFMVLIHKWGKELGPDEIIAPSDSHKGVLLKTLGPGTYFINPLFYDSEVYPVIKVPAGNCLVQVRKFGRPLPAGQILAHENPDDALDGERGVLPNLLLPGSYEINPYAYDVKLPGQVVEVNASEVGVRTLKVGKDPATLTPDQRTSEYTVPTGYRGLQREPLPQETYYVNPFVEAIYTVDTVARKVSFSDIVFPSRDGFFLRPDVVVEYAVMRDKATELLVRLTDEGVLHQADTTDKDQLRNEVLQKVVLPHVRGYTRIEGSNFYARDFIVTQSANGDVQAATLNAREKLQAALVAKVGSKCAEQGIEIRAITLQNIHLPEELLQQIWQRDLAKAELDKAQSDLKKFESQQDLAAKNALTPQATLVVQAQTTLKTAKIGAQTKKGNAELSFKQNLISAQLQLDASQKQAEAALSRGKAEATVIQKQNEAEVAGLKQAVSGFPSPQHFAQYQLFTKLGPALHEVFSSDDGDFAKLFSGIFSVPSERATKPTHTDNNR
jgi:hypothetical protein